MLLNVLAWVDGVKMFWPLFFLNINVSCLVWCRFFKILVSGILAAIDTFSEHVIIGVSWVVDTLFMPFFNVSDMWCLPNLRVIKINTSLLQIFYFVGFALFCLETLLSIGVLQVWKFFPLNNYHSAPLTFQCSCKLVDVPLCNSILDEQSFFGIKV